MTAPTRHARPHGPARPGQRRDEALIRWLRLHPGSELHEIAEGLRRGRRVTRRRLLRLETEGRVRSTLMDGPVFFVTVYEATGRVHPLADAARPPATRKPT